LRQAIADDFFRDLTGPPALSSLAYANAVNEVKAIGATNSTTRTAGQTNAAMGDCSQ
jgi:hypothetical protein